MLTGVGATIAAGSHEWNGYWADLVRMPSSTSTSPAVTAAPPGGAVTSSWIEYVPAAWPMSTKPPSMASPPALVMRSAWREAARAIGSSWSLPMSRYEVIDVSSQHT